MAKLKLYGIYVALVLAGAFAQKQMGVWDLLWDQAQRLGGF